MNKYTVLTTIGCAIFFGLLIINTFIYTIPTVPNVIIEVIAAIIMIVGLYFRKHDKN